MLPCVSSIIKTPKRLYTSVCTSKHLNTLFLSDYLAKWWSPMIWTFFWAAQPPTWNCCSSMVFG
jgi:hypothetical protein